MLVERQQQGVGTVHRYIPFLLVIPLLALSYCVYARDRYEEVRTCSYYGTYSTFPKGTDCDIVCFESEVKSGHVHVEDSSLW